MNQTIMVLGICAVRKPRPDCAARVRILVRLLVQSPRVALDIFLFSSKIMHYRIEAKYPTP